MYDISFITCYLIIQVHLLCLPTHKFMPNTTLLKFTPICWETQGLGVLLTSPSESGTLNDLIRNCFIFDQMLPFKNCGGRSVA